MHCKLLIPLGETLTALAISSAIVKGRPRTRIDPALNFLNSIESVWKGYERFAIWLVQKIGPSTVVDLGFDRGLSVLAFAYKNRGSVFGIDWFEEGNYAAKSFALDIAFRNISTAIRLGYAKNIHLILGPFCDISKKWARKIDILHIDGVHTYRCVKRHYTNWKRYLKPNGIILIHNVISHPQDTGRFFEELSLPKFLLPNGCGLGVASEDASLIEEIEREWALKSV